MFVADMAQAAGWATSIGNVAEGGGILAGRGLADMLGFTYDSKSGGFHGWGHSVDKGMSSMRAMPSGFGRYASFAMSGAQTLGPMGSVSNIAMGLWNEGLVGGIKYGASEFVASTVNAHVWAQPAMAGAGITSWAGAGVMAPVVIGGMLGGVAGSMIGEKLGVPLLGWTAGYSLGTLAGGFVAANPELYPVVGGIALAVGAGYGAYKGMEFAVNSSYGILKAGYQSRKQKMISIETAGSTAAFVAKSAYTMRSRAVQAINKHQLNARSALGQEATLSHFNSYRRYSYNPVY
jgi:hypothetical protein